MGGAGSGSSVRVTYPELRGDGRIPVIAIEAANLAEATHRAILACYEYGARVETPKHRSPTKDDTGTHLGYDADMIIRVANPDSEPKIHKRGIVGGGRDIMQYILEVTHGIHDDWLKSPEHPEYWGYTYSVRFKWQIPFVLQRIRKDWEERREKEGQGRITGRDYNFNLWIPGEDIILEQEDPPCWQRGNFRFLQDSNGKWVMNYTTDWRSRDLLKAWNHNNIAQVELMKLFAAKVSNMLGIPIELGAYIDRSSSLHLYGSYIAEGLEAMVQQIRENPYETFSVSLDDWINMTEGEDMEDIEGLKRFIAAQMHAEAQGHGKQCQEKHLTDLGYDLKTFQYPEEWDTWPKLWDKDPEKLRNRLPTVPIIGQ